MRRYRTDLNFERGNWTVLCDVMTANKSSIQFQF